MKYVSFTANELRLDTAISKVVDQANIWFTENNVHTDDILSEQLSYTTGASQHVYVVLLLRIHEHS